MSVATRLKWPGASVSWSPKWKVYARFITRHTDVAWCTSHLKRLKLCACKRIYPLPKCLQQQGVDCRDASARVEVGRVPRPFVPELMAWCIVHSIVSSPAPPAWVGQIWTLRVGSVWAFSWLVERNFHSSGLQIQKPSWVLANCVSVKCAVIQDPPCRTCPLKWDTLDHIGSSPESEVLYALQYELACALQLPPHRRSGGITWATDRYG